MSVMSFREPNEVKWIGVRPAHKGTQIFSSGLASNSTVVLHTVSLGKTLYLVSYGATAYLATTGISATMDIYDSTPALWQRIIDFIAAAVGQMRADNMFWPPLEIPSGYSIRLVSTDANAQIRGFVFGWEE